MKDMFTEIGVTPEDMRHVVGEAVKAARQTLFEQVQVLPGFTAQGIAIQMAVVALYEHTVSAALEAGGSVAETMISLMQSGSRQ